MDINTVIRVTNEIPESQLKKMLLSAINSNIKESNKYTENQLENACIAIILKNKIKAFGLNKTIDMFKEANDDSFRILASKN